MKKFILLSFLILLNVQLKAMDPLSPSVKKLYEDLEIKLSDLSGKTKDERWDIVKKAYRISALKYHPDKNRGKPNIEEIKEKWNKISDAYTTLEKLLTETKEPTGPTFKQRMEEDRFNSTALITEANKIDQPEKAHDLYNQAIDPFISQETALYGLDIIGIAAYNTLEKYFQKKDYEKVIEYGKKYIVLIKNYINKVYALSMDIFRVKLTDQSYVARMGKPYEARDAKNEMITNFEKIKTMLPSAFDEVKKIFTPLWIKAKQDFNSGNVAQIKNALEQIKDYFKYEYRIDATSEHPLSDKYKVDIINKDLLAPSERNEYIKGYLKLADAYLYLDNIPQAEKTLKEGLNANNEFKVSKQISFDFTNEFESRLNLLKTGKKPSAIPQNGKNLFEALKQLIRSFSALKGKLSM